MKSEHKIILLAVSLGLAVWVLDTILDFLFFVKGDFTDLLILNLSVHEIFMRLTVFIVFLVFGILMAKRAIRERELRQDLQKSGEEMAVTLKSIGDAVIATDKNGNVQFMNPVAESLTRWTISEAFGEPIERVFNIVNEQTEEKAPNPIERVLREGKVVGLANHTVLVAKHGKRWPIDDSGAPIKDDRGNVIGAVLVFHDVSERRKAEKQINHLNEILRAIRNVNQLITQVKDRDDLLRGVCRELVNTRGFNSACIVLEDGVSRYVASSEIGNSAVEVQKQFQQGYVPSCFKQVREKDDVHVIKEPKEYCRGCPASGMFEKSVAMSCKLEHNNRFYGVVSVAVPRDLLQNTEEISLFEEVAGDISFALHDIEISEIHKKSVRDLQYSEALLQEVGSIAKIGGWELKPDVDRVYWTEQVGIIHETDPDYHPTLEEAIEFYAPEYREMVANAVQASIEERKSFDFEAEIITRQGRRKWVRALGQPELKDGRAVKLFGTFQEITDIKKTELRLREAEERFSLAMRGSNDGFSDWADVSSDKIWWSPRFFELLGYKPFEFQPTMSKFKELLHPEDHKKVSQAIEDHFENDNDFDVEYRLLHKSGEYRWFHARGETQRDEEGKPVRMSGAVRDITIRKQTEMALKQSERNLRMLFEQMVSGFAQLEMTTGPEEQTPDFKYLDVNSAFERIVGLKKSDLVGKTIREVHSETEQYWLDFFREVVLNRQPAKLVDYHKDTDKYYEVIAYSPKENHLATIMTDITKRKKAELRIRDSEERLNQIIMGNAVATFVIDKNHKITHWNHACEKLTGMSRYEVIGTDRQWEAFYTEKRLIMADLLIDGLPEDEIARHYSESFRRSSLISGAYESEEYFSELQKEGIWIYITTAPIRNSKGKLIGAIETLQDITVRKRALESLGESEERFRTVSQQALIGILIFQDNRLKFVNNAFTRIVGYSVEELHEKYADELDQLIHEDDRQLAQELRQKLNSRDDKYLERVSWRVLTKDGEVRWVDNFAKRITYKGRPADIFSVSDITDRVRAELELESEKERLNVTLRSIGDGVIATDREHNIILFNKVAEEVTGFSEEEALGKPLQEVFNIINDSTREKVENPVQQVLYDGTIINLSDNTVLISRDGRERSIADSGSPIRDHDGNVVGVVIVFRDITETKRLQEFASRAQRLETAGRIAGQVAHDFNNLLGPLTAYPSLIRDEIPADHIATEYVNQIEKSARQMADINQQLLTLGRRGHYALEPLNLNEIVIQVIKQLYPLTESIAVDTDLAEELFNIRGGASQIYRVVANLVSNALDAIKETGGIRISTENFYSDRISGRYGQVPKGEYVKLTVTDSGEGIQPELMPKIFDPFFTTKVAEGRRGSGLGLSVVHSVIEDHHGYIDVSSTPGKGTSFFLYFPITRESALSPVSDKIIGGHEEILVVDDDPTQREVTRVILEKLGYRTTTAKSGEEALVIIERKSFDLLILDMIMPGGIDGAETYRRALELRSPQKAVIVSGYAESERVDEAVRLGASLFLRKPVTIKSIAHAVRKVLDYSRVR